MAPVNNDTKLKDFPLSGDQLSRLSPRAKELTKSDLLTLAKLKLTVGDASSIQDVFADTGAAVGASGGAACSSIVCCCTASAIVKPVRH